MNDKLNPQLVSALNSFLYYLKVEKGMAENSVQSYRTDLVDFLSYNSKLVESYTASDIVSYFVTLQSLGLVNTSLARKRVALKQFFLYLSRQDMDIKVDFDQVPKIRISQHLPDFLTVDEMFKLLDSLSTENPLQIRNKVMMEVLYATGLRISELLSLTIHDIIQTEKIILVRGKGSKQRYVPLLENVLEQLTDYISNVRPILLKYKKNDFIFLNKAGNKMSRMGFWK
ncbi:MAG: tyrosine-type recombinase/integrase, partial [Candidatus Cloacimonadaceae bacterium]